MNRLFFIAILIVVVGCSAAWILSGSKSGPIDQPSHSPTDETDNDQDPVDPVLSIDSVPTKPDTPGTTGVAPLTQPTLVEIRVFDFSDRSPIENAEVSLTIEGDSGSSTPVEKSGADGIARFSLDGPVQISRIEVPDMKSHFPSARGPNEMFPGQRLHAAPDRPLEMSFGLEPKKAGVVLGQVRNAHTGAPVTDFNIRARWGKNDVASRRVLDANGRFVFGGLPPGEIRFSVTRVGFADSAFEPRIIELGENTLDVELFESRTLKLKLAGMLPPTGASLLIVDAQGAPVKYKDRSLGSKLYVHESTTLQDLPAKEVILKITRMEVESSFTVDLSARASHKFEHDYKEESRDQAEFSFLFGTIAGEAHVGKWTAPLESPETSLPFNRAIPANVKLEVASASGNVLLTMELLERRSEGQIRINHWRDNEKKRIGLSAKADNVHLVPSWLPVGDCVIRCVAEGYADIETKLSASELEQILNLEEAWIPILFTPK